MNDELQTLHIGALRCIDVGWPGEHRFLYLPGDPRLDRDGNTPMLHLLRMGSADQLSLQMSWEQDPEAVDAARQQLQARFPGEPVSLLPAELDGVHVMLVMVDDAGVSRELGPFTASGTSSNRLALVEAISREDAQAVQAAMDGAESRLRVRYGGGLRVDARVELTLQGSLQPVYAALVPSAPAKSSGWFPFSKKTEAAKPPVPTIEQVRQAVDSALSDGSLTLDVRRTAQFSDDALTRATAPVVNGLVRQILDNWSNAAFAATTPPEDLRIHAATTVPERREWHIQASADLGRAFAGTAPDGADGVPHGGGSPGGPAGTAGTAGTASRTPRASAPGLSGG
ncbi:hypothetical protein ACQ86G_26010 [Roseateles chitinivorans]|uniref:hypothetical protein n=1 Tax=Roseateles chitinivorans TaxID=2917965 RepID=UPI003D67D58B